MMIAALVTIVKIQTQSKRSLIDEWIKMWYITTMEYYSSIKKNEILLFVTTCMNLKGVMLSE